MTVYYAIKRISDGVLVTWQSSPFVPDEAVMQQNAVTALGGVPADYTLHQLTKAEYIQVNSVAPARPHWIAGSIVSYGPPLLSWDSQTVENDGTSEITLTVNTGEGGFTGTVNVTITSPDTTKTTANESAVAGVATFDISTHQEGTHTVLVMTDRHGLATSSFEGI